MQYDKTTGTFYLGDKAICRGFYGTETHKVSTCDLTPPSNVYWAVTEAKNGTGLRLFSIPLSEHDPDWEPFHQSGERVWYLATYKNLSGHLGRWKDGGNKTFGQMFNEIVGDSINKLLEMTSGNLCVSYFMRHRDNDIHNEMGDEESHVIQTIVWDSDAQQFIGPSMPNWPTPPAPVLEPTILYSNKGEELTNEVHQGPFFKEGNSVEVQDGHPLLFTIYCGPNIVSCKLITYADEYVRQFRSRSHSRFVALMVCQKLSESGQAEFLEELQFAKARLFTKEELEGFAVNVQAGKDEFFEDLDRKYDGGYVAFHKKIYNNCRIGDCLNEFCTVNKNEDPEQYEVNRQALKDKVWSNLLNCTGWRKVGALEAFWQVYVRASLN